MENNIFTFHVHLPEEIEKCGQPVVIGNVKELGLWEKPIVKLRQPFPQNPTYWQSEPVVISFLNVQVNDDIKYKYAIHMPRSYYGREEKIVFEGNYDSDNRILDTVRSDQFCIWENNFEINQRFHINPNMINDFAFIDYVFNSIKSPDDLKDKIMIYQYLLTHFKDLTIRTSSLKFIFNRLEDKLQEKRLFLCLVLGYFVQRQKMGNYRHYKLPPTFPSQCLLEAFEDYKQETLPSDTKEQMYTAITTLVQHNAFRMKFDWLIIFTIATEVDPGYTFLDRLRALKYSSDNLLTKFIKEAEMIKIYTEGIELETYVKLAKWLIQLCHNMDSLFKLWSNVLSHNNVFDQHIFKCFIDRVREDISHDDAVALEDHFKRLPKAYRNDFSYVFRDHALFLLESPNNKWTNPNINAIQSLLQNENLNWHNEEIIQSLEFISKSQSFGLLNIFPEILDGWFRSDFSDTKKRISTICVNWFTLLLTKLDTYEKNLSNESNFIFLVFQQLERMYPLLGLRINIWRDLTGIAIERVNGCSESRIFAATKLVVQIKQDDIKKLFLDTVKEILSKTALRTNDQLLNKIFTICGCKGEALEVPNLLSEDILCYIMIKLQSQSIASDPSEYHLDILGASKFWNIIFRATGNVKNLHSSLFVQRVRMSVNELGGLLCEKMIEIQLLQQLLEYSDEKLFQHFDAAVIKENDVIISRDEITELRKLYDNYQLQLEILFKFYTRFCSVVQVTDVNCYIQDVNQNRQNSSKLKLKQILLSDYWAFHEKILDSARRCYEFNKSQTFRNIFDACLQEDAAATKVEYIAQNLVPIVFEKYNGICEQFKEWENLKSYKSQMFVQTLDQLSKIPHWVERLEWLEKVIGLFEVPHNEYDWLSKSIRTLKDDSMKLMHLNN
ncbi:hypothetical protein C1645_838197, partial [Glomus cerebriforme]